MSIKTLFNGRQPNILIIMNDQQRALQHWPESWAVEHLPALQRLKANGMSFEMAMTVACACSASRGALLTGTYPTLNGVMNTLTMCNDTSGARNPGGQPLVMNQLRPTDANLARIMNAAGYTSVWKGKWHLSAPVDGGNDWTEADIAYMESAYGFSRWNPNDAGNSEAKVSTLGAGSGGNDARYMTNRPTPNNNSPHGESIEEYLRSYDPKDGPFFLTVSFVNPHDVWVAPTFPDGSGDTDDCGYRARDVPPYGLEVPDTFGDSLLMKPAAQAYFQALMAQQDNKGGADLDDSKVAQTYVNFYAYLQTLVDAHVTRILDLLDDLDLTRDTLIIRTSDHGEMGLSHGLREKEFVAYDEAIRIPLVVSNPIAFPTPQTNQSPVANIDLAPTLARLVGVSERFGFGLQGEDLTPILTGNAQAVRDAVHFMTDDASAPVYGDLPNFIRALRTPDWMYSVYFTTDGTPDPSNPEHYQFELYDMQADPKQRTNQAGKDAFANIQQALHAELEAQMLRYKTVPNGFLMNTPALQTLLDSDDADSITNPIWPTPEQAFATAAQYVEAGGWKGVVGGMLRDLAISSAKDALKDTVKGAFKSVFGGDDDD